MFEKLIGKTEKMEREPNISFSSRTEEYKNWITNLSSGKKIWNELGVETKETPTTLKRSKSFSLENMMNSFSTQEVFIPPLLKRSVSALNIQIEKEKEGEKKIRLEDPEDAKTNQTVREMMICEKMNQEVSRKASYFPETSDEIEWAKYPTHEGDFQTSQAVFEDEGGKRVLQRASVDFLINSITTDFVVENNGFLDTLLLTHPIFISSDEFLERLFEMFRSTKENDSTVEVSIRKARVINAIKRWIEFNDVKEDEIFVEKILRFIGSLIGSERSWGVQLQQSLYARTRAITLLSLDKLPKTKRTFTLLKKTKTKIKSLSFMEIDPIEFANHMTAADWNIFKRIKPSELLNQNWASHNRVKLAPNLAALIENFNWTCNWIASEILLSSSSKIRVSMLERFIELCKMMKTLQNFHGMIEVYSALNMLCIQRLTDWKSVSRKHISIIQEIERVIDSDKNWKNYRQMVFFFKILQVLMKILLKLMD